MSILVIWLCLIVTVFSQELLSSFRYFRSINITNSGVQSIDQDVLIVLDTSSLISQNKLLTSCADLRFYDSSDTQIDFWMPYYDSCGSVSTFFWITLPLIDVGETVTLKVAYSNSSVSSGGDLTFGGNFFLFSTSGICSLGIADETLDDAFLYVATTDEVFGSSVGSHTHGHTASINDPDTTASFLVKLGSNTDPRTRCGPNHGHNLELNLQESVNTVEYFETGVTCSMDKIPSNGGFVSFFFVDEARPFTADWKVLDAAADRYLRPGGVYETTGGSSSHTHDFYGVLSKSSCTLQTRYNPDSILTHLGPHDHAIAGYLEEQVLPEFITVVPATCLTRECLQGPDTLLLADSLPPKGFETYVPASPGLLRATNLESGAVPFGGSATHDHLVETVAIHLSGGEETLVRSGNRDSINNMNHTHDISVTSTTGEHLPVSVMVKLVQMVDISHLTVDLGEEIDTIIIADDDNDDDSTADDNDNDDDSTSSDNDNDNDDDDADKNPSGKNSNAAGIAIGITVPIIALIAMIVCAGVMVLSIYLLVIKMKEGEGKAHRLMDEEELQNVATQEEEELLEEIEQNEKASDNTPDSPEKVVKKSQAKERKSKKLTSKPPLKPDSKTPDGRHENTMNVIKIENVGSVREIYKSQHYSLFKSKYDGQIVLMRDFHVFSQNIFNSFKSTLTKILHLNHPNTVQIFGYTPLPHVSIFTEYCELGHLKMYFSKKSRKMDIKEKLRIIVDVAKVLQDFNRKKHIHGGISAENVFLKKDRTTKVYPGLPRTVTKINVQESHYAPPEVVQPPNVSSIRPASFKKNVFRADTFSLGILFMELLSEDFNPYNVDYTMEPREKIGWKVSQDPKLRPKVNPKKVPSWAAKLMKGMWEHIPGKRTSLEDIISTIEKNIV